MGHRIKNLKLLGTIVPPEILDIEHWSPWYTCIGIPHRFSSMKPMRHRIQNMKFLRTTVPPGILDIERCTPGYIPENIKLLDESVHPGILDIEPCTLYMVLLDRNS